MRYFLTILVCLQLFSSISVMAETIWDFSKCSNTEKLTDTAGCERLSVVGEGAKIESGELGSELYLPEDTYLFGNSANSSLDEGTYKIWVRIKNCKDWDGLIQTHVGYTDGSNQPKYMGVGFKRIKEGVVQAFGIPGQSEIVSGDLKCLNDGKYHSVAITFKKGKVADGNGFALYIDDKLIGKKDYEPSGAWNKGKFFFGACYNKGHSPEIYLKKCSYNPVSFGFGGSDASTEVKDLKREPVKPIPNNMVENFSFEKLGNDSWPMFWNKCEIYSLDPQNAHSGKYSLKYRNSNPHKYLFVTSPIKLQSSKRYRIGGWIKAQDIRGAGAGACFAVEYYNSDNKYLGGTYTKGIRNTNGQWKKVEVITNSIPASIDHARLACFVSSGMSGSAWWDDLYVVPFKGAVLQGISTNIYRNESFDKNVIVKIGINPSYRDEIKNADDFSAELSLKLSDGTTVKKFSKFGFDKNVITFTFNSDDLEPGLYDMECNVILKNSGDIKGKISCPFRELAEPVLRKVFIDEHKRVIVNGKPFFPLGTYWSKVSREELEIYSKSSFNCIMPYDMIGKFEMDMINQYGLKFIYSLKDVYFGTRWCPKSIKNEAAEKEFLVSKVKLGKNHPGLLAWYINDERPLSMLPRLIARQQLMKELDSDHPTWAVLCQLDSISPMLPTCDVIGTDPYPIPDMPAKTALEYTRTTVGSSYSQKAVWMVPQIFNWASYAKSEHDRKRFRAPTLEEMRSMAWQCIAGGSNGLVFYSWFDVKKRNTFDKRWDEICEVAAEIKEYIPVLLSIEPTPECNMQGQDSIVWRLQSYKNNIFLITVNAETKIANAEFTISEKYSDFEIKMGKGGVKVNGNKVKISYKPLEVKIICLKRTNQGA